MVDEQTNGNPHPTANGDSDMLIDPYEATGDEGQRRRDERSRYGDPNLTPSPEDTRILAKWQENPEEKPEHASSESERMGDVSHRGRYRDPSDGNDERKLLLSRHCCSRVMHLRVVLHSVGV
jgi:hypothetical protein